MIGILPDQVRELYRVPAGVQPLTGLAIGHVGDPNTLAETYRQRDLAGRERKHLAEFMFGGQWGTPSPIIQ